MKNNIALSSARYIMRTLNDNKKVQFQELKDHLLKEKRPEKIIDDSFKKSFQPRKHERMTKMLLP